MKKRCIFGKENMTRNWDLVCWSDKSTFELGFDGRTVWITRAPREEFLEKNLKPSFKSGRTSVGVWGCFMGKHLGPLVILEKGARMNQHKYFEEVLKPYFIPFYKKMVSKYRKEVVIQEDGAGYHYTKMLAAFKARMKVKILSWPPQSPDLSPIENLWKQMKDRIARRRHRIRTIEEMEAALRFEWANIEEELLVTLVESMPKRMAALKKAKGGSTKY